MASCLLGEVFTCLKKSSKESVENIQEFNKFSNYMHVERQIEEELKKIIQKSEKKQLILLCGNVGDGKSHTLSYFKNELKLLDDFTIYNDATESFSPGYDCVKNLANELIDFNDENLDNNVPKKIIIAINLGTLSNFLNSDERKKFTKLFEYVKSSKILNANEVSSHIESVFFNHVNFTDYKVFSLTKNGCKSDFILKLFDKVFDNYEKNEFYKAYQKCSTKECPLRDNCILRMNYEYCMNKKVQQAISKCIIEIIIKDKLIISTRQLLNIIYDIIVPANFNINSIENNTNFYKTVSNTLNYSTPSLLFEHSELSNAFKSFTKIDPVLYSSEVTDELSIEVSAIDNLKDFINGHILNSNVYSEYLSKLEDDIKFNSKDKIAILKNIIRCNSFSKDNSVDSSYNEFASLLYSLYSGKSSERENLGKIYNYIKNGIMSWYGTSGKDNLCQIKLSDSELSLHENLNIEYDPIIYNYEIAGDVDKFLLFLEVKFKIKSKIFIFNVDYNLYNLVKMMSFGYRPNVEEKNKFISFSNAIDEIILNGDYKTSINIIDRSTGENYILKSSPFGGFTIGKEI